jgi:uncharacterized protein YndB with AHSA1/START domain
MSPTGRTADAGWQAGARRTFPVAERRAWELLVSPQGQELWLGGAIDLEAGGEYALADGTRGELRAASNRHLRLTWEAPGWSGESTVQVRVLPAKRGTTIAFHHERLADEAERERALERWSGVLDALGERLG